jgi:hypothetical protein
MSFVTLRRASGWLCGKEITGAERRSCPVSDFILCRKCSYGSGIREDETDGACGTCWRVEKCLKNLGWKT